MQNKNNILTGILAACIFPAIAFVVSYELRNNIDILNRPALPYLFALFINLVLTRICMRKGYDVTAKGILFGTFAVMLLVFIFKVHIR